MKLNIAGKEIEVADEVISKAIEEKQDTISIESDLVIRTATEEASFKENLKAESTNVAMEIGRKNVLKGIGIELNGEHKSDEKAISALTAFIDSAKASALKEAKIEPEKQVTELKNDVNTLKNTISNLQSDNTELQNKFDSYKQNTVRNTTLSGLIPDNTLNDKKTTMLIMNNQLKTGFDDNGNMYGIGADGQPMKDPTTLEVLPMEKVVANYFDNNPQLLKPSSGGAGGGDSSGGQGGKMTIEQFNKQQNEAGNPTNGPEYNKNLQAAMDAKEIQL